MMFGNHDKKREDFAALSSIQVMKRYFIYFLQFQALFAIVNKEYESFGKRTYRSPLSMKSETKKKGN